MDDSSLLSEDGIIRLSSSPAGTPRIVRAPVSPVQSTHLDTMEDNMDKPPIPSPRPANFMDDPSDEEGSDIGAAPVPGPGRGPRRSSSRGNAENSYLGGTIASGYVSQCQDDIPTTQIVTPSVPPDGCLKLTSTPLPQDPRSPYLRPPPGPRADSWYEGEITTPVAAEAHIVNFQTAVPGKIVKHSSPRASVMMDVVEPDSSAAVVAAVEATNEAIKDIHTQTMQALLRNEDQLQIAVIANAGRVSFVPDSNRVAPLPPTKKRVSMAPPPIDIGHRGSLPDDIVRTPYPFFHRKAMPNPSPLQMSASVEHGSILAVSIRRHGTRCKPSKRVSMMTIPAKLETVAAKNPTMNEKHFETLDYDDAHFFRELRKTYHSLTGPFRHFSARTLHRIDISHSMTCGDSYVTDYGLSRSGALCTHDYPRSPRFLASRGLTDSFSAEEMMRHYKNPRIGNARYAWVHWAHRISIVAPHLRSPAPAPPADSTDTRSAVAAEADRKEFGVDHDCPSVLELVEGWCVWRILLALSAILVFAFAAALCWIFLGSNVFLTKTGYRDAGERVVGGMMIGVFVLLTGWTGIIGWIGVSWLVD